MATITAASPRPAAQVAQEPSSDSGRMVSLDALRGFDMFWIVGAGPIALALRDMHEGPVTNFLSTQLTHVQWEGFHAYDLIFPLFLFIMGVSMVFSLDKALDRGVWPTIGRIVRRSLLLFALGVFYYGGISKPWPDVQLGGVLPRIAACYLGAALIYVVVRSMTVRSAPGLAIVAAMALVSYWAILALTPFPDLVLTRENVEAIAAKIDSDSPVAIAATVEGRARGVYEEGRNLTNYLDFRFLPGRKAQKYYINEGLLSTLPALALPLLGAVAGLRLRDPSQTAWQKIGWLAAVGALCVVVALAWSLWFPMIKRIWTSSFVLFTAGLSMFLLALFYYIVDVLRWRTWCQPFLWIGANAITAYLLVQIVDFRDLAARLVGGDVRRMLDEHVTAGFGGLIVAAVGLALLLLLLRLVYVRRIFIRV